MKLTPISDLCSRISSGGTPSRKRDEYFCPANNTGHLWVKSKELLDSSIATTEETITDEGLKKSAAKYFPAQTVLVAMYGANVGQLGWLAKPATVNQAICGLVADETKADWRYLFYALLQERAKLITKAQGAAQQNLNQDAIRNFDLPIPDLPTQRKIAGILSAYDDLIENNLRRIKILEEMAQSLYREWFVYFRFPGHESATFVDSDLGLIPKGWKVKKLAEIARVNAESIRATNAPEDIQYIDIASVSTGSIDHIEAMNFESAPSRARRVVRHGDIIWSTVRPNRRSFSLIIDPAENLIASTGFAVLSARTVPWSYLYQATTTEDFTSYLVNHASGAAYPAVNSGIFENADVIVPSSELLTRFNALAEANQVLQHNLHSRNQTLRQTRDLLLPRLLSGEESSLQS